MSSFVSSADLVIHKLRTRPQMQQSTWKAEYCSCLSPVDSMNLIEAIYSHFFLINLLDHSSRLPEAVDEGRCRVIGSESIRPSECSECLV